MAAPLTPFLAEEIYSNLVGSLKEEGAAEEAFICATIRSGTTSKVDIGA
ncbi:MAG: hypothetical protein MZU79_03230 [Anaerotruncus sp.]|nr:hypothetical protein [Anaerotruncus sp.]